MVVVSLLSLVVGRVAQGQISIVYSLPSSAHKSTSIMYVHTNHTCRSFSRPGILSAHSNRVVSLQNHKCDRSDRLPEEVAARISRLYDVAPVVICTYHTTMARSGGNPMGGRLAREYACRKLMLTEELSLSYHVRTPLVHCHVSYQVVTTLPFLFSARGTRSHVPRTLI